MAVLGDWCAAATNTNVHTYEVAPCYTVMESEVVSKVARLLGGPYATSHDGLLVPGGSIANLYGMQLARDAKVSQNQPSPPPPLCSHLSLR